LEGWKINSGDPLVLLNPGSDRPSRRWPAASFAEVADRLAGKCSAKIVIIGNKAEEALAHEIIAKMEAPAHSSCGLITLGQLVALIARARLLITTNSAAMHLAGMQNIPFVAVSGSADPWRDRPEGSEDKMAILWKGIKCGPCAHFECPERESNKCMKAIRPEDVLGRAEIFLKSGKP
jgi:ADP-heptose:LPS heptosyltransferase